MKINWKIKKFGDVCDILDNKRKPITKRNRISGKYPYYGATGILDYVNDYIFDEKLILVGEDGAKWESGESTAFIADGKYWVNNHAHVIRPHRDIVLDNWVVSFFFLTDLTKYTTGLTVPKLNQTNFKNIKIPLPPLPEQIRIVEILDEVFEEIAEAKENAERNLVNAKELFESYLQKVFVNGGDNWEEKRLGEILEIERGGSPRPINSFLTDDKNGINWIKIGDTKKIDKYIYKTKQKIIPEGLKKSKLVKKGDFILSNSMSFGKPYIMKITGAIHDGWLVLREKRKNEIDKDYLYNILKSPFVFKQFDNLATGSTVRNLNITLVSSVKISFPKSLPEQKQIVKKLDALVGETKKLEAIYKQKLADLEELKKSVLKKAFEGEL